MSEANTFHLFARPSALEGAARIFDLGGTLQVYNEHETGKQADIHAIHRDWKAIGDDIRGSLSQYEQEQASQK